MPSLSETSPPDPPCKKVLALLTPVPAWEEPLCAALETAFGPMDYRGAFVPFEDGGYYAAEMGAPLHRAFCSFRGLSAPQDLPEWKWRTRALEAEFSRDGRRTRNLDVGYLDPDKLVLASFKQGPAKLYLGRGVWADAQQTFAGGRFAPTPWAFPDFLAGRYTASLLVIREKLKAGMRR